MFRLVSPAAETNLSKDLFTDNLKTSELQWHLYRVSPWLKRFAINISAAFLLCSGDRYSWPPWLSHRQSIRSCEICHKKVIYFKYWQSRREVCCLVCSALLFTTENKINTAKRYKFMLRCFSDDVKMLFEVKYRHKSLYHKPSHKSHYLLASLHSHSFSIDVYNKLQICANGGKLPVHSIFALVDF